MSARDPRKCSPAERAWLDAQRERWTPLTERQALTIRAALRSTVDRTEHRGAA